MVVEKKRKKGGDNYLGVVMGAVISMWWWTVVIDISELAAAREGGNVRWRWFLEREGGRTWCRNGEKLKRSFFLFQTTFLTKGFPFHSPCLSFLYHFLFPYLNQTPP